MVFVPSVFMPISQSNKDIIAAWGCTNRYCVIAQFSINRGASKKRKNFETKPQICTRFGTDIADSLLLLCVTLGDIWANGPSPPLFKKKIWKESGYVGL